jgi:hypothetical protein
MPSAPRPIIGIRSVVPVAGRPVIAVAELASRRPSAWTRRSVTGPTVCVDVIEEWFVVVDVAVIPRGEFLDRPETLIVVNVETVVGESDWLDLRRGSRVRSWPLGPDGQRFGLVLIGVHPSRPDKRAGPCGRGSRRR